ncbi:MAG: hypothetical protein OXC13_15035, partial [Caldilineaceae bacterium]|nr:hypothetical protein [Caldilineaceae bacterium]
MLLPSAFYPHAECIAKHLPHLRPSQVKGLALWVGATILARSSCQNAVLGALVTLGGGGGPPPPPPRGGGGGRAGG